MREQKGLELWFAIVGNGVWFYHLKKCYSLLFSLELLAAVVVSVELLSLWCVFFLGGLLFLVPSRVVLAPPPVLEGAPHKKR